MNPASPQNQSRAANTPQYFTYETYRTPYGYWDQPYSYIFDATSLVDGQTYIRQGVAIENDSDFVLRHIGGLDTVAQSMLLYGPRSFFQQMSALQRLGPSYAVVPEIVYPAGSFLPFDLGTVARASIVGGNTVYVPYLLFQGVKRFPDPTGSLAKVNTSDYLTARPYTYSYTLNLNWKNLDGSGQPEPARQQIIPIDDYDFELFEVRIINADGTPAPNTTFFRLTFFTQNGQQLSSFAVPQGYANALSGQYDSIWPAPALLFKRSTLLRFNVTSMLANATANQSYRIDFVGVQKMPR